LNGGVHEMGTDVRAEKDDPDTVIFFRLLLILIVFVLGSMVGLKLWLGDALVSVHATESTEEAMP
jgi:hypothetical protein